ncbi:DUF305 domain-containing protein [Pseudanabaena mucicola]|uniref:DUF305 domain-containing protein n=1 Tax=Pseudanabaena mucicola FACHB-723 TaxID=2692860 RepID=A0ABR8A173_9CYAN|nr:DUF305 domain-containing protein [Pseudanabaena mucicola]MBD2189753.1 DUF305 domain-containing protein [Pseudanabaena mucicola FACHB-723]
MQFPTAKHQLTSILLTLAAASGGLAACTTGNNEISANPSSTMSQSSEMKSSDMMMSHGGSHSMELGKADAEYDLRFIDGMTPHHQGAVVMAQDVLKNSKRPELRKLANDIIAAQEKEIAQMATWRKAWYPDAGDKLMMWHGEMNHSMEMTPEFRKGMMMSTNLGKADDQFDLRFIDAMIPHHEGALIMAKDAIAKSKRPEIQKLAQEIFNSQQQEIEQMQSWRKDWYGK